MYYETLLHLDEFHFESGGVILSHAAGNSICLVPTVDELEALDASEPVVNVMEALAEVEEEDDEDDMPDVEFALQEQVQPPQQVTAPQRSARTGHII